MEQENPPLSYALLLLLVIACGVIVANLYYLQPIGPEVAQTFRVFIADVGRLNMLIQLGYAMGLLFSFTVFHYGTSICYTRKPETNQIQQSPNHLIIND